MPAPSCRSLHHDRRFGDAESGAAEFLRHRDAEPAAFGDRLGELEREGVRAILLRPIVVVEPVANGADRIPDLCALRRVGECFHRFGFLIVVVADRCLTGRALQLSSPFGAQINPP